MLIDCSDMSGYRNTCELGRYISMYRGLQPQISSAKIYALFLNDSVPSNLKEKILTLYHMKIGWHTLMGINLT